jgi:hypothetical protein
MPVYIRNVDGQDETEQRQQDLGKTLSDTFGCVHHSAAIGYNVPQTTDNFLECTEMDELARTAHLRALHTYLKKALKEKYAHIVAAHVANAEIAGLTSGVHGLNSGLHALGTTGIHSLPGIPALNTLQAIHTPYSRSQKPRIVDVSSPQPQQRLAAPQRLLEASPLGAHLRLLSLHV